MRTVFDSKELPHLWAHQQAEHGRCPADMSFRGKSFYSYGTEIGRIIERKGRKAYLVNATQYSVTTSNHQNMMRAAIPGGETVFTIGDFGRGVSLDRVEGPMLFEWAVKQSAEAAEKAERAKANRAQLLSSQSDWLKKAQEINEWFGLRRKVDEKAIARLAAQGAAAKRKRAKEQAERQKRIEVENAEKVQQWLDGASVVFPSQIQKTYLRIEGNEVVTSRGARVPVADAQRAYRFALAHREKGWKRNGEQFAVGGYQLDAINRFGIVAGCHRLDWATLTAFAERQGWPVSESPSPTATAQAEGNV